MYHCALNPIPICLWFCFSFPPLSSVMFLFPSVPWAVTGNGSFKAASLQKCRAPPSEPRFPLPPSFCTRRGPNHRKQLFLQNNNACDSIFPCAVSPVPRQKFGSQGTCKKNIIKTVGKKQCGRSLTKCFEIPRLTMTVNKAKDRSRECNCF